MRIALVLASFVLVGCIGSINGTGDPGEAQPDAAVRMPDAFVDPMAARRLLEQWSGCMTLANFNAANMATAWGSLASGGPPQLCRGCHSGGEYGFMATLDEAPFLAAISQHSSMMSKYFSADVPNAKVIVNVRSFEAANRAPGHPRFDALNNPGMTALQAFQASTAANTACGAPQLID